MVGGSTRDYLFQKKFPKLYFLKVVSVVMIANSKKMKIKKSHPACNLWISSPLPFSFPPHIFRKLALPTFSEVSFHPLKKKGGKGWGGLETYVCPSKNLSNDIWLFPRASLGIFWKVAQSLRKYWPQWLADEENFGSWNGLNGKFRTLCNKFHVL